MKTHGILYKKFKIAIKYIKEIDLIDEIGEIKGVENKKRNSDIFPAIQSQVRMVFCAKKL